MKGAIQERLVALVCIKLNPASLVLNLFQAVRRVAVHSQHFARLRIENDDRAVLAFELVNDCLLQFVMNRNLNILARTLLNVLPKYDLQCFGDIYALNAEECAFKPWVATV